MARRIEFKRMLRVISRRKQQGIGLAETLVAVAVLGTAVTAFVSALSTGVIGVGVHDEGSVSQGLAQSQMEYVKSVEFVPGASSYPVIDTPSGYDIEVDVSPLRAPGDADIQLISVTVLRDGQSVLVIDGYKVNR